MTNPEGMTISEEEMGIEKPKATENTKETPLQYAEELRGAIKEASSQISDLERQRNIKASLIAEEEDVKELKIMIDEYNNIDEQLSQALEKLNDATLALETTAELGVVLPKKEEEMPEFDVDVSDLEDNRDEMLEALADVAGMNDLLTQRDILREQLKEAGRAKDEEKFEQLTDSYILISKEIEELAKVKINQAKKVETLTEIKKMAA